MKQGLVFNGCENGIGDISNNSISVYISDKALSFFDDMKVNQTISYSREQYIDQLAKLNDLFSAQLQKYKQNADKEFKPYSNNNLTTIFNSNNSNEFNISVAEPSTTTTRLIVPPTGFKDKFCNS